MNLSLKELSCKHGPAGMLYLHVLYRHDAQFPRKGNSAKKSMGSASSPVSSVCIKVMLTSSEKFWKNIGDSENLPISHQLLFII